MSRAFFYYQLATIHPEDRDRALERTRRQARAAGTPRIARPSLLARSRAGLIRLARGDRHALTEYPCRLPDGTMGRTAILPVDGEWVAVCAVA